MDWNTSTCPEYVQSNLESHRKKVVGEPDEGKPHVRFDVAGDENQDRVIVLRHSQKQWGVNRLLSPTSQASSPDPTSRPISATLRGLARPAAEVGHQF